MEKIKIKFAFENRLSLVPWIGAAVHKFCTLHSLPETECFQIQLCAVEALNNVIQHALPQEGGHEIELIYCSGDQEIVLQIIDDGRQMDDLPEPVLDFDPQDLKTLPEGGMGRYLLKEIMDDVEYRRENGQNILTMKKRLSKEAP